jgi:hypothetical protein
MYLLRGIASSTHVDTDGDQVSLGALYSMAEQINDHYILLDYEHQGIIIGVVLCAMVKQMEDGEWALRTVEGIFESEEDRQAYEFGAPNTVFQDYLALIVE